MADTDMQAPAFGEHGEPCQECGAPLAADQRYCLNCGRRRAEPRVDYRRLLADVQGEQPPEAGSQQGDAAAGEPDEPVEAGRDYAPLAAVGGIAVLGLMLLVGVLIGKGNSTTTAAPAPIVKVGGEVAPSTAGAEPSGEQKTGSAQPKSAKKSTKGGTGGTGAKTVDGGLTGSAARNSKATVQATTDDLEELNSQSGDNYQETIKKLPDKIATPGKPPPIDTTKAPGGGGAAETIE
jgi:hypothetical protein